MCAKFIPSVQIRLSHNEHGRVLLDLIEKTENITAKGEAKTNIIRPKVASYCFQDAALDDFIAALSECYKLGIPLDFMERQNAQSGGIMIDLDVWQTGKESHITPKTRKTLISMITRVVMQTIDVSAIEGDIAIPVILLRKPAVIYNKDKKEYKDGAHILFPTLHITNRHRQFIVRKLAENQSIRRIFSTAIRPATIVDEMSAHVPNFLLGNNRVEVQPYVLDGMFIATYTPDFDHNINLDDVDINDVTTNPVRFCSLNWGGNAKYPQRFYAAIPEIMDTLRETADCDSQELEDDDISTVVRQNPDVRILRDLLDILPAKYYDDYAMWLRILFIINNTAPNLRNVAEWFSRKSEKFSDTAFATKWAEVIAKRSDNPITIRTLHKWAREDVPEKYEQVVQSSYFDYLLNKVWEFEGDIGHYNIAQILRRIFNDKFVTDIDRNMKSQKYTWYEFVYEEDPQLPGEIYKYRSVSNPNLMKNYLAEKFPIMLNRVVQYLEDRIPQYDPEMADFVRDVIIRAIRKTRKSLQLRTFKKDVIEEAESIFQHYGFTEELDNYPDILGVQNGVLKLGEKIEFINYYHDYKISLYTAVAWRPFDPTNPIMQEIIRVHRAIIPEDDAYVWIMMFLASSLDYREKSPVYFSMTGNGAAGKSTLCEQFDAALGSSHSTRLESNFLSSQNRQSGSTNEPLMALKKKRFAWLSETSAGEKANAGFIKDVVDKTKMSGAAKYGKQENFVVYANIMSISNNMFIFDEVDDGIWRRVRHYRAMMKFADAKTYDPNNPLHILVDVNIKPKLKTPEYLEQFFSYCCWVYEIFMTVFGGRLENVHSPTIDRYSLEYRNKQDTLNRFITQYTISSPGTETPTQQIAAEYSAWLKTQGVLKSPYTIDQLDEQIRNSRLAKYIEYSDKSFCYNASNIRICTNAAALENGESHMFADLLMSEAQAISRLREESRRRKREGTAQTDVHKLFMSAHAGKVEEVTKVEETAKVEEKKTVVEPAKLSELPDNIVAPKEELSDSLEFDDLEELLG